MWFLLINLISLITGADSIGDTPKAELLFVGDAMQHQAQLDKAKEIGKGKYDYSECFSLIAPIIQEADYAVCNLEVPLGGKGTYSGYPCFSANLNRYQSKGHIFFRNIILIYKIEKIISQRIKDIPFIFRIIDSCK